MPRGHTATQRRQQAARRGRGIDTGFSDDAVTSDAPESSSEESEGLGSSADTTSADDGSSPDLCDDSSGGATSTDSSGDSDIDARQRAVTLASRKRGQRLPAGGVKRNQGAVTAAQPTKASAASGRKRASASQRNANASRRSQPSVRGRATGAQRRQPPGTARGRTQAYDASSSDSAEESDSDATSTRPRGGKGMRAAATDVAPPRAPVVCLSSDDDSDEPEVRGTGPSPALFPSPDCRG
jgi:hypothetical protein